jgi:N6-adenosine-specific RNA methylase IME4
MPLDNIKAMPVTDLAAKDCTLLMWATFRLRGNAELWLLATRGKPKRLPKASST